MMKRVFSRSMVGVWAALATYGIFLRRWHLRWGATPFETQRHIPGDEVIPHPELEATRAVSILAPPENVWPWLVQMGFGRAGFYSYDAIDNGGTPSADRIIPEFQAMQVGDFMPLDPSGGGFVVSEMDPPRSLVLTVPDMEVFGATGRVVVTFSLESVGPRTTRLVCRLPRRVRPKRPVAALLRAVRTRRLRHDAQDVVGHQGPRRTLNELSSTGRVSESGPPEEASLTLT